jgi:hypothetical protein
MHCVKYRLQNITQFATVNTFFYSPYFRSDSSQDILLAKYVSAIVDITCVFDWENVPKFASFDKVTVGSLINLCSLQQKDIARLVKKNAPGQPPRSIDNKAKTIEKRLLHHQEPVQTGRILQGSCSPLAGLSVQDQEAEGHIQVRMHPSHPDDPSFSTTFTPTTTTTTTCNPCLPWCANTTTVLFLVSRPDSNDSPSSEHRHQHQPPQRQ